MCCDCNEWRRGRVGRACGRFTGHPLHPPVSVRAVAFATRGRPQSPNSVARQGGNGHTSRSADTCGRLDRRMRKSPSHSRTDIVLERVSCPTHSRMRATDNMRQHGTVAVATRNAIWTLLHGGGGAPSPMDSKQIARRRCHYHRSEYSRPTTFACLGLCPYPSGHQRYLSPTLPEPALRCAAARLPRSFPMPRRFRDAAGCNLSAKASLPQREGPTEAAASAVARLGMEFPRK